MCTGNLVEDQRVWCAPTRLERRWLRTVRTPLGEGPMNQKRYWLCVFGVLVVARALVSALFFGVIFQQVFDEPSPAFRGEGEENFLPLMIGYVSWAFFFVYLFAKHFRGEGWKGGVSFAGIVWFFYFVPMTLGIWSFSPVTSDWVVASLISGLAESLTGGLIVGTVYKRPEDHTGL
jgi:hypothetical protein